MNGKRSRWSTRLASSVLAAMVSASIVAMASSASHAGATGPAYSIDFHAISAGSSALRNSCFALSATVGQAAPGYSSETSGGVTDSVYAGFWSAAPVTGLDEIFFSGFQGC